MAISRAEKAAFNDEIKVFKESIEEIKKKISDLTAKKRKMPNIGSYYNIEIVHNYINLINTNINSRIRKSGSPKLTICIQVGI